MAAPLPARAPGFWGKRDCFATGKNDLVDVRTGSHSYGCGGSGDWVASADDAHDWEQW